MAKRTDMRELGYTGLDYYGGKVHEEFLVDLKGTKARKVYNEMASNDPVIGAMLYAVSMLVRQVEWSVMPASDSPEDVAAQEFIESCMDDMSHSWEDMIVEILSMLPYGWHVGEIVYKKRDDGLIGWRKIATRGQNTLEEWLFDENGGISGMVQSGPPSYKRVTIPMEKMLLFRASAHFAVR